MQHDDLSTVKFTAILLYSMNEMGKTEHCSLSILQFAYGIPLYMLHQPALIIPLFFLTSRHWW